MNHRGRRWSVAVALLFIPSLMAAPSHASTPGPEPETTPTEVVSEPTETIEPSPAAESEAPTPEATPEESPSSSASVAPERATSQTRVMRAAPSRAPAAKPKKVNAAPGRWVSIMINHGHDRRVMTRENFWLRGRVLTTRGKPQARAKVKIFRDTKKGRKKVATVRTSKRGWYRWSPATPRGGKYRAHVSKVRNSTKIAVKRKKGKRTLVSREKSLGFLLGAPQGAIKRKGAIRWREYAKGTLVRYKKRTWLVRGAPNNRMRNRGGPTGDFGPPTRDIRCGLPEGACLQQFRTGAVYINKLAKKRVTSAVGTRRGAADLVAVAKSQVGYREPRPRQSKYNRWIGRTGSTDPWCGFFVSWLAHAAGKPGSVIKAKSFAALLRAERKRGRTTSKARVGRLAYFDYFSRSTVSHVGIVLKVSGDHVWTIEGNVSSGGGMNHPRGVHVVKRHKAAVAFYANPRY